MANTTEKLLSNSNSKQKRLSKSKSLKTSGEVLISKKHLIDAITPYLQSVSLINDNQIVKDFTEGDNGILLQITEGGAKA
jgi:hypothetical protein